MDGVNLLIITVITATSTIFCDDDLTNDSVVFSITSHGRLFGEIIFSTLKDVVGDCLYTCMQHMDCLTINYHRSSRRCKLMADVLFKKDIIDDPGWESYGHFESSLVSYIENYVLVWRVRSQVFNRKSCFFYNNFQQYRKKNTSTLVSFIFQESIFVESQKRPSVRVLIKRCSEIYRRTSILKCDFNKVACKGTLWKLHFGMSVLFITYFKNTSS